MDYFGLIYEMHNAKSKQYIVASIGEWNKTNFYNHLSVLAGEWFYVNTPEQLLMKLEESSPEYIFFPHWRWIVPKNIVDKFECICFHMTDVPYGRGGSPLQNLIVRGHKKTILTALKMEEDVDTGPVYMKRPLDLTGAAHEIYERASLLSCKMIEEIAKKKPQPIRQQGKPTIFKRRNPGESLIPDGLNLDEVYDYIRMLDAPGYPKAFIVSGNYRLEFDQAKYSEEGLTANVNLIKINKD